MNIGTSWNRAAPSELCGARCSASNGASWSETLLPPLSLGPTSSDPRVLAVVPEGASFR